MAPSNDDQRSGRVSRLEHLAHLASGHVAMLYAGGRVRPSICFACKASAKPQWQHSCAKPYNVFQVQQHGSRPPPPSFEDGHVFRDWQDQAKVAHGLRLELSNALLHGLGQTMSIPSNSTVQGQVLRTALSTRPLRLVSTSSTLLKPPLTADLDSVAKSSPPGMSALAKTPSSSKIQARQSRWGTSSYQY